MNELSKIFEDVLNTDPRNIRKPFLNDEEVTAYENYQNRPSERP